MRVDIYEYAHHCDLCQGAKLAQFTHVGLHSASPVSGATERLFADFIGTLNHSKQGNVAILVVLDVFSKFVSFSSVRKFSSLVVCASLKRAFFPFIWYAHFHSDRQCQSIPLYANNGFVFSMGNYPQDYYTVLSAKFTHNISAKFLLKWSKPVIIAKIVQPNIGLLVNPKTGGIITEAYVSQLQPFVQWLKVLLCIAKWTHIFCLFTLSPPPGWWRQHRWVLAHPSTPRFRNQPHTDTWAP